MEMAPKCQSVKILLYFLGCDLYFSNSGTGELLAYALEDYLHGTFFGVVEVGGYDVISTVVEAVDGDLAGGKRILGKCLQIDGGAGVLYGISLFNLNLGLLSCTDLDGDNSLADDVGAVAGNGYGNIIAF